MKTAQISRRALMGASVASLVAANLWPGALAADGVDAGDFRFVVANDLHYFNEECGPFFQRLVRQMKAHRDEPGGLDLMLLAGDLSDWGQAAHYAALKDLFSMIGVPYHVVCGNHDWADWGDRAAYVDAFPKNGLNYSFEHKGWQIVALDSTNQNLKGRVKVTDETFGWISDNVPKLDKKRPTIAMTHFPMHPLLQWPSVSAADVLGRFRDYNLQAMFNGHCHAFREQKFEHAFAVTNVCCSRKVNNHDPTQKQKGYFLCEAKEGRVTRTFIEVNVA